MWRDWSVCPTDRIRRLLRHHVDQARASEFAKHELIDVALGAKSYFAAPYPSWQRGTNDNDNGNGLIRQYCQELRPEHLRRCLPSSSTSKGVRIMLGGCCHSHQQVMTKRSSVRAVPMVGISVLVRSCRHDGQALPDWVAPIAGIRSVT